LMASSWISSAQNGHFFIAATLHSVADAEHEVEL
jgi:hypothetical protein